MLDKQDLLCQNIKELVNAGLQVSDTQYQTAIATQSQLRKDVTEVFKNYDALLCAPATGEAPKGLGSTGDPSFCALGSFLGIPAINIPAGKSKQGLPLGAQLMGNYKADAQLLRVARFVEESL
jgi:Asp-tRNA(Asn)/Glu-tRNA(Gln) amidotransferase A subunit family amidase